MPEPSQLPPEALRIARQMLRENPDKYQNIWKFYNQEIKGKEESPPEPKKSVWQRLAFWRRR